MFLAATIIEVANVVAIELGLLQHGIDLVMDKTSPTGSRIARRYLRGVLFQMLLKMGGTFAAGNGQPWSSQQDSFGHTMDKVAQKGR